MESARNFNSFVNTIKALRGPNGCPWDNEQTIHSLTPFIIEEAYELVSAIKATPFKLTDLQEELGDVLLHIVMIANMASELGMFTIDDVITHINDKIIRRHPHVFGTGQASSSDDVVKNWEKIKLAEKQTDAALVDSIPASLPGLMQFQKMLKRAARSGKAGQLPSPDSPWIDQLTRLAIDANEQGVDLEDLLQTHILDIRSELKGPHT